MKKRSYTSSILILTVSVLLIGYNILRILNVAMTFDETEFSTYFDSYDDILSMTRVTANNHILNSILRKSLVEVFNDYSPFFIRLDNLLAQVVFLIASFFLLKQLIANKWWVFLAFLWLNLNPFMFEFWGLSRGYGLSIAFMTAAVCLLVHYWQNTKTWLLLLSFIFAIAAVYSNFSLLNFYLAFIFILLAKHILFIEKGNKLWVRELWVCGLSTALLAALIVKPIRLLVKHNELFYGGERNIVSDTLMSLVSTSLRLSATDKPWLQIAVAGTVIVAIVFMSFYWVVRYLKKDLEKKDQTYVLLWVLFLTPIVSVILQHYLFGTRYLIERTALFLVVLFKLSILTCLFHIYSRYRQKISYFLLYALAATSLANFILGINVVRTTTWSFDEYDLVVINKILKDNPNTQEKIKVWTSWIFNPSFSYYGDVRNSGRFYPMEYKDTPPGRDTSHHYYYIRKEEVGGLDPVYVVDTSFRSGEFVLMRKGK